jgi:hypothetical protein
MKTKLTEEVKKLIQLNVCTEDFRGVPGNYDITESGKYGYIIDWDNLPERYINICEENIRIIKELTEARNKRIDILVGDYLRMPDGSESRVTYNWDNDVQDGGGSGSFFLCGSGNASYSGGLNGLKPINKIHPTKETKKALFWIFSRNSAGGNRGFYFYIDVKVWQIDEMLKTAYVKFNDWKYNYHTNVNGKLSDEEVKAYFVGKFFNLGDAYADKMQQCIDCAVYYS